MAKALCIKETQLLNEFKRQASKGAWKPYSDVLKFNVIEDGLSEGDSPRPLGADWGFWGCPPACPTGEGAVLILIQGKMNIFRFRSHDRVTGR